MKKNSAKQYAEALWRATKETTGKDRLALIKNFVLILIRERQLKQAPKIIEELIRLDNQKAGCQEVILSVARPLTAAFDSRLQKFFLKKAALTTLVDASLVGGAKIQINDRVWDGTLKKQLLKLKNSLIS